MREGDLKRGEVKENGREEGDGKKIIFEREEERKKRKRVWLMKESMENNKEEVCVGV